MRQPSDSCYAFAIAVPILFLAWLPARAQRDHAVVEMRKCNGTTDHGGKWTCMTHGDLGELGLWRPTGKRFACPGIVRDEPGQITVTCEGKSAYPAKIHYCGESGDVSGTDAQYRLYIGGRPTSLFIVAHEAAVLDAAKERR